MPPSLAIDLARHANSPALVRPDGSIVTYADLDARVTAFAGDLDGPKMLVAIEMVVSEHAIVAYLAAMRASHAVALLPADAPEARDAFVCKFEPDMIYRRIDGRWRFEAPASAPIGGIHPDLALLMTTSGSTGEGKAVRLSARAVESNAVSIAECLGLTASDRAPLVLPLHYSYGLSVLNSHLAVGASLFLPDKGILDEGFIAALRKAGCTSLPGVPYSYDLLETIGFREQKLPALLNMTVAGGRLDPELVATYRQYMETCGGRFHVMYGQTEATARIASVPPAMLAGREDRIGRAIRGGSLSLLDPDGIAIDHPGTQGELVYRGPNVMMGYAGDRAGLALGSGVEALHTGDLAILDEDGFYRIVGRLKRMSKIAGLRIGHDALEAGLARHGIQAAVVGDDRSLLAVFTTGQPAGQVREKLAVLSGLTLRHVNAISLSSLPRLASGKVDYSILKQYLDTYRPPDAEGIAATFRQVFFPHPVNDTDSFASLGGDSLRHVELSLVLERRLGEIPENWEDMSIAALSRLTPKAGGAASIGTDLVLRALAVLLVVVNHQTLWPLPGGAAAMMVLAGYGIARFQRPALLETNFSRFFRPLAKVLPPYFLIVAAYAYAWGEVPWASVILAGNFGFADPERHSMVPYLYWFVEAYTQLLLLLAGLFLVPLVRRVVAADAFRAGAMLLAGAIALHLATPYVFSFTGGREIFSLPWVLNLALFGWCAATADTAARRRLLLGIAIVVMPIFALTGGNWVGSWTLYMLQIVVIGLLLYAPKLPAPARVAEAVLPIAAASYHIYLFHRFVPELLMTPLAGYMSPAIFNTLAIVGGVLAGLLAFAVQNRVLRAFATLTASRLRVKPLRS